MNGKENNIHDDKINEEVGNLSCETEERIPSAELKQALEELEYMEKHPEEYKSFNSVSELMEDLMSEDN